MTKDITGPDRKQLSRLVELVAGDHEIALAPRILGPLGVVRVTLMYCGWSWKSEPCPWSGKHKRTEVDLQVMAGLGGRPLWACDPLARGHSRRQGHRRLRHPGRNQPLPLHRG